MAIPASASFKFAPKPKDDGCPDQKTNSKLLSVSETLKLFNFNQRSLMENLAQVTSLVQFSGYPQLAGFTETHCQRNIKTLATYHSVSQLDKRSGEKEGGIALYARHGFEQ